MSLGERAAEAEEEEVVAAVLLLMFGLLLIPLVMPLAMLPPVLLELTQMH